MGRAFSSRVEKEAYTEGRDNTNQKATIFNNARSGFIILLLLHELSKLARLLNFIALLCPSVWLYSYSYRVTHTQV